VTAYRKGQDMKISMKIITTICIIAVIFSAFYIGKYLSDIHEDESHFHHIAFQDDDPEDDDSSDTAYQAWFKKLNRKNPDFAAWIIIPGTKVDYPVMRANKSKPEFYLHRNFDGEYSASGALFMPYICDPAKPSDNIIIYGHNMRSGTMFGSLRKYEDKDFADKHSLIKFGTSEGRAKYRIAIVFAESVGTGEDTEFRYYNVSDFDSEEEFNRYITDAKDRQLYETGERPKYGDKLLTLSTCEYTHRNGRLVIIAYKDHFLSGGL
jgi:sortase B